FARRLARTALLFGAAGGAEGEQCWWPACRPPGRFRRILPVQPQQFAAGAGYAALDGPDGAVAHFGRLPIAKAAGGHEDQGFTLRWGQSHERLSEFVEDQTGVVMGGRRQRGYVRGLQRFDDVPVLAQVVEIAIAQDREDPGLEVGARRELVGRRERQNDRILHEIVGLVAVAGQRARKRAQMRQAKEYLLTNAWRRHRSLRRSFFDRVGKPAAGADRC